MEEITFRNVGYQTRLIELPILGNVLISTTALNEALMTGDGGYVSIEASQIDEKMYYFVEDVEIQLPDSALSNLLLKQII